MKKTPVFTLKIVKSNFLIYTLIFVATILITYVFCSYPLKINLSQKYVHKMLLNNIAFSKELTPDRFSSAFFEFAVAKNEKTETTDNPIPTENLSNVTTVKTPVSSLVKVNNRTPAFIEASTLEKNVPAFLSGQTEILIVHTHGTESYTPSEKYAYTPSDTDRTQDKNFNVIAVGNEIEKTLKENGHTVYHDETLNDYPSYNGSYNRSSEIVANYIKKHPSIKIVLDIHRDAIEAKDGSKVKPISEIDGKDAASIMFVVGSNQSGLKHDNWQDNLAFAYLLQKHTESLYKGLCKPINMRNERFNQHLAPGAIIVEVGTNGNTLDEALLGANYFAKSLSSFIKSYSSQ